jgi:hypothetical protein
MAIITVGSTPLPNPKEWKVKRADLDSENTTRSETGVLTRDRIRAGVYSISVSWENITKTQLKTITDAVAGTSFQVTFFDPTTSSHPTITAYASDKDGELAYFDGTDEANSLWNLSFNIIQF